MSYFSHVGGGQIERICDVCGIRRAQSRLRVVGKYYVCEKHPGWVPREVLERQPYVEIGRPEPVKNARGFEPRDTFEVAERVLFDFLTRDTTLGHDFFDVTGGAMGAASVTGSAGSVGAQAIYLYELIVEGKRPQAWIDVARRRLRECGDWLVSHQVAGPYIPGTVNTVPEWGAYDDFGYYYPIDVANAGLGLLRAYQVFGTERYLDAARACAWFIRGMQCGDKLVSGAVGKHYGTWAASVSGDGLYTFDHTHSPRDLVAMEFLHAFLGVAGDETIGSSATTAVFASSRAALVSTCIAEAKEFWTTPQGTEGIAGLSTATPRSYFYGPDASWRYDNGSTTGTGISTYAWAGAIRAFRAVDGDSAFVLGLFDWLATFQENTAYALPSTTAGRVVSGYDDRVIYSGVAGPFNAAIAPPTRLLVLDGSTAIKRAGASLYDLAAAGNLAGLYSSRQRAGFVALKQNLSLPAPRSRGNSDQDGKYLSLGLLGACGFSWQPYSSASLTRTLSTLNAAIVGRVYRQEPKAFLGRGAHEGSGLA